MPTLTWVGKDKVVNHHHDVPFRVLDKTATFRAPAGTPANSTDNRIIHGDNLEALKSLLPEFEGRVKCIYIDPPYNTGNEGWVYNDAVNDPKIKRWLGQVVGKEGEDLSRHDKWLCMMYPRLKLLHRMLAPDGAIFISIDDNEVHNLRSILDEIFGANCFAAHLHWQKRYTRSNNTNDFSSVMEHVLAYGRKPAFMPNLWPRDEDANARYANPDNDPRGPWKSIPFSNQVAPERRPNLCYDIVNPNTGDVISATKKAWRSEQSVFSQLTAENRVWWGADGKAKTPNIKRFLTEVKDGMTPTNFLDHEFAGHTDIANAELKETIGPNLFDTPKPSQLILRLIQLAADSDSIILDSFAGSGTTAHSVLKLNAADNGKRRFILIEMMDYADSITAERVRRVATGYGEGPKAVAGLGGGFDYYEVGEPLFRDDENLNEAVGIEAIRSYVAHSEGIPLQDRAASDNACSPYLLGRSDDVAWLFYYEPDAPTALDLDFLATLQFGAAVKPAVLVVYADRCLLAPAFMAKHGIRFKKIPRDISRF